MLQQREHGNGDRDLPADPAQVLRHAGGLAVQQQCGEHVRAQLPCRARPVLPAAPVVVRAPALSDALAATRGPGQVRRRAVRIHTGGDGRETGVDRVGGGRVQERAQPRHAVLLGFYPHPAPPAGQPVTVLLGPGQQPGPPPPGQRPELRRGGRRGLLQQLVHDTGHGLAERPLLGRPTGHTHQVPPQVHDHLGLARGDRPGLEGLQDPGQALGEQDRVLHTAHRRTRRQPQRRADLVGHVQHRALLRFRDVLPTTAGSLVRPACPGRPSPIVRLLLQLPHPVDHPQLPARSPCLRPGVLDQLRHSTGVLTVGNGRVLPEDLLRAPRPAGGSGHVS